MKSLWERIAPTALVVLIALSVGFVIGGGLNRGGPVDTAPVGFEPSASTTTSTTSTTTLPANADATTSTTLTAGARSPAEVNVRIYNGSHRAGAAVAVGKKLSTAGYHVLPPGPSPAQPTGASVIQFRPGFAAEAAALATLLGVDANVAVPMPDPATLAGVGEADLALMAGDDVASASKK